MTYSYDPTQIRQRGKDQMRFELGDTQTEGGADTCALSDEEYTAILDGIKGGKKAWLFAKLAVLEAILFKLSYQVDTKIDVLEYDLGARADRWKKLYDDLKKQALATVSIPTLAPSMTETPPYFHKEMQTNHAAMHPGDRHSGEATRPFRKMTT